jgi:hypothetical protein
MQSLTAAVLSTWRLLMTRISTLLLLLLLLPQNCTELVFAAHTQTH